MGYMTTASRLTHVSILLASSVALYSAPDHPYSSFFVITGMTSFWVLMFNDS